VFLQNSFIFHELNLISLVTVLSIKLTRSPRKEEI
jgi:hypothetical protein